ncbi:protein shortage in chiasmata 1 ortholog [Nematolebias whitei]|uniref:protein shortage in chiasmata 1 ortholog n=1 Tax=Nematolebias whitei TaxID=451745 RepID=UPI001897013E|nr:protein shortage in chiasmata 1 ortholog [Nematolebias whitei]
MATSREEQSEMEKCEKSSFGSTEPFSAVRFRALDYVFETSTTLKVTMNLLALPEPYLTGASDLYPHRGKLTNGTYRTPWIRGKVISSCKLFVGGSDFDEHEGRNQPVNSLERFSVENHVEVIPSSNPDSLEDFDLDQLIYLKEPQIDNPYQESFLKWSPDLLIPEELVSLDYLPQFRRLPSLKAKLSRLKMLPVADPLLSPAGLAMSEDAMSRCYRPCASYQKPPDVDPASQTCADVQEEFIKEPLLEGELLLLPAVVDTPQLNPQNFTTFSSISAWMIVSPEQLYEQWSVLDLLHNGKETSRPKPSVDISCFDVPTEHEKENKLSERLIESEFSGRVLLPAEMELDLILSPIPKTSPNTFYLSTSHLQEEQLPPFGTISLVSARTQNNMEAAVWKAEKHLTCVATLLLSEPYVQEPAFDFQPLSEALSAFKLEKQSFGGAGDKLELQEELGIPQVFSGHSREFTENMMSDSIRTWAYEMEDFEKLLPEESEESIALDFQNIGLIHQETSMDSSQSSFLMQAVVTNNKEKLSTVVGTKEELLENKFSGAVVESSAQAHTIKSADVDFKTMTSFQKPELNLSSRSNVKYNPKSLMCTRRQPENDLDPLSAFITLRSLQAPPADATPPNSANTEALEMCQQTPQKEQRPPLEEAETPDRRSEYVSIVASGDASREQKPAAQRTSLFIPCPAGQSNSQDKHYSRVVQIQATDSQQRAYRELLAFAQPFLTSARQMGLNFPSWGDFSCLAPDQTHFLLKQQERALCRAPAECTELVKDQELLFNQAALIHVLVTFKELLLKCGLGTALEYLTEAAEVCAEQSLKQLLKRLQIILFLSHRKQEADFKLLELQQLLADWLLNVKGNNSAEKILIMLSVDSDESRSLIISCLSQVNGAAVTSVCPDENINKLNGAGVVSSVHDSNCVVVFEQHIGPDFPWSCFSLVVEFDRPGPSPWSSVCSERSLNHLSFTTSIADDAEKSLWCLEDNVPFTVLVTEGLLNCPMLLLTLESSFSVNVLERSHCPTLQMLGGIHNYTVITVDESTAIIIQEQDELSEERASEGLVMRLTALSLQYSCCWLILRCPDSQGGGLSSEAFNNLVLVYSSLVLFNMKAEELDVKVLIVSEVLEMATFINHICFTSLMSRDGDPVSSLNRDWLTVMPSQEEACLSQFPCINPLVSQLMLNRAPSLKWLLGAPLPQLKALLPEVPHKVLKLFSDITSLYSNHADPKQPATVITETNQGANLSQAPHAHFDQCELLDSLHSQMFSSEHTSFLHEAVRAQGPFSESDPNSSDFRLDLNRSFGNPNVDVHRNDLLKEEEELPVWCHRAAGRTVGRVTDDRTPRASPNEHTPYLCTDSPLKLNSTFSCSPVLQNSANGPMSPHPVVHSDLDGIVFSRSPPSDVPWGQSGNECLSSSRGVAAGPASYGFRCWKGLERKRSSEGAGLFQSMLEPPKRGRLSYERVPGRRDGQTRLKLF